MTPQAAAALDAWLTDPTPEPECAACGGAIAEPGRTGVICSRCDDEGRALADEFAREREA